MGFIEKIKFVTTVLAVGNFSSCRSFPLRKTPFKIKVNAYHCVRHDLKSIRGFHLPKLYPGND